MDLKLPEMLGVGYYDSDTSLKGVKVTKERRVNVFEIELPLEKGGIAYVDEEEIPIDTSFVICARPGQTRHTKTPYKSHFIHFEIGDGEIRDVLMKLPSFIKTGRYEKYYEIFHSMYMRRFHHSTEKYITYGLFLELLHLMVEDSGYGANSLADGGGAVQDAISYIRGHLDEELSLGNVAHLYGYSPTHFHKLFRSVTGKTMREYIEDLRMEKAIILLEETDYTLSRIAYECGFSSQSYFNYAFKRKMKTTPRGYILKDKI